MQTLHVIMNQQHIERDRLPGKTVVVLDVLFATTTIAMALHHGARDVLTVAEVDEARRYEGEGVILAGEKDAEIPDGFDTFAPEALSRRPLAGKRLVLVSTNGTVALANSRGAAAVYTAALVNNGAVASHLVDHHRDGTILLVCSASRHRFNIEDFIGAGLLVEALVSAAPDRFALTDAALAARTLGASADITGTLRNSRVGRMMHAMDLDADIDLAATVDLYDVVPGLEGEALVATGRRAPRP